jgi:chromate transporter
MNGQFEWFSALLGTAAFVALFRYRIGVIAVILGCGATGLVYRLLL